MPIEEIQVKPKYKAVEGVDRRTNFSICSTIPPNRC